MFNNFVVYSEQLSLGGTSLDTHANLTMDIVTCACSFLILYMELCISNTLNCSFQRQLPKSKDVLIILYAGRISTKPLQANWGVAWNNQGWYWDGHMAYIVAVNNGSTCERMLQYMHV